MKRHIALSVFLRYLFIYFFMLALLIAILIPVYVDINNTAKEIVMSEISDQLIRVVDGIETLTDKCGETKEYIAADFEYQTIASARNKALPTLSTTLIKLQKKLGNIAVVQDDHVILRFLMFTNNSFYIDEYVIVDDYSKLAKTEILRIEELTSEELHNYVLGNGVGGYFKSTSSLFSNKLPYNNGKEALLYILPIELKGGFHHVGAMVFALDVNQILQQTISERFFDEGNFTLVDKNGQTLISRGVLPVSQEDATTVTARSDQGLMATMSVSKSLISESVNTINNRINRYVIIGCTLGLILILAYTFTRFIPTRKVIEYASEVSTLRPKKGNTYDFILSALNKVKSESDDKTQELKALQELGEQKLLKHAYLYGLATQSEVDRVREHLLPSPGFPLRLIVCTFEYESTDKNKLIPCASIFELNAKKFMKEVPIILVDEQELILIIGEKQLSINDMELFVRSGCSEIADQLGEHLSAGISDEVNDVNGLPVAYTQAKTAIRILYMNKALNVSIYNREVVGSGNGNFNINMLIKLGNMLSTGQADEVEMFFDDWKKRAELCDSKAFRQQFYAVRMQISNTQNELRLTYTVNIPDYMADIPASTQIEMLKECAVLICEEYVSKRKSKNELLLQKILDYINTNYTNAGLNAEAVAHALNVSAGYVQQLIIEQTGKSFAKTIEEARLEYTKNALINTNATIEEISTSAGFGAANTLFRVFRKNFGVTPGEYRKNNRTSIN